ncbi:hypothetical protein FHS78_003730 [Parvibaculum indicum]|uniref:VOC family protein n=1 Tax=Parvibaculum indicum TaxID=562969 RepID=UPI00141D84E3|nr:VOC family protein [Parvibaculum indicum]NIJ43415.1 hypothetical protein [Parvibaculum indicum]
MTEPNRFRWYELMTTDKAAAGDFYAHVVGWTTEPAHGGDGSYTLFLADGTGMGGMMALPEDACDQGAEPGWIGYVAVPDVDDYAGRVERAGGAVLRAPDDVPNMLRFAVVADPSGVPFVIFKGTGGSMPDVPLKALGHAHWHELYGGEVEPTFGFYSDLFGWTKDEAMDMGDGGVYQLVSMGRGEAEGAMMKGQEGGPSPRWNFYFRVGDIKSAIERIKEKGGQVTMGPYEVPSGDWIVQGMDPQGAAFSLVAPK